MFIGHSFSFHAVFLFLFFVTEVSNCPVFVFIKGQRNTLVMELIFLHTVFMLPITLYLY